MQWEEVSQDDWVNQKEIFKFANNALQVHVQFYEKVFQRVLNKEK